MLRFLSFQVELNHFALNQLMQVKSSSIAARAFAVVFPKLNECCDVAENWPKCNAIVAYQMAL